jgi:hypothetical protein
MTQRLARKAAGLLARRTSRRGFLTKVAVVGSAIAVAPVKFLTRPVSAQELVNCPQCGGGACCDGWTTFCCTINQGANECPADTYMGGWWKCTDYRGSGACSREGVRYYVDCNRTPGSSCPHGCHCANDSCSNRRTCCNVFRYGQCDTHVAGVTEVVCRVIKCDTPAKLYVNCGTTLKIENAVCSHEASCL